MKRNSGKKHKRRLLQVWSYDQTLKALPYLLEVLRSLRENYLAMRFAKYRSNKISQRKERPDRSAFIEKQEALMESEVSSNKYKQDVAELGSMDMFVVSPGNGVIAIPFIEGKQLAWFILELYSEDHVAGWRYQTDPLETRRAILPKHKGTI